MKYLVDPDKVIILRHMNFSTVDFIPGICNFGKSENSITFSEKKEGAFVMAGVSISLDMM